MFIVGSKYPKIRLDLPPIFFSVLALLDQRRSRSPYGFWSSLTRRDGWTVLTRRDVNPTFGLNSDEFFLKSRPGSYCVKSSYDYWTIVMQHMRYDIWHFILCPVRWRRYFFQLAAQIFVVLYYWVVWCVDVIRLDCCYDNVARMPIQLICKWGIIGWCIDGRNW